MASVKDFDFSADVIMAGGPAAAANWKMLERHTVAEWSGDLDGTMATMTRNAPFQIMYATGLDVHGWDNVREFYRRRMETFQGQGFFAHRWVVSEAAIVGQGYFSGAPTGAFFGVQATGKTLLIPITVWIYFEDGLIKGESSYLDGHELRRQLREGASGDKSVRIY
jgi:predicted ester cyclase